MCTSIEYETTGRGSAQDPFSFEGQHERGKGHIFRRKAGIRGADNVGIRACPDEEDAIEGSAIAHLEKFDPLSSDNLNRAKGAQGKLPEELLIQRAAYDAAQNDNLLVAMKYKELVPVARQGQFEEKIREISKKLMQAWKLKTAREKTSPSAQKAGIRYLQESRMMETNGCNTRYNIKFN